MTAHEARRAGPIGEGVMLPVIPIVLPRESLQVT